VCFDDEAPTEICRISMSRTEWEKLAADNRVELARGLSGRPIEVSALIAP
jgi:hypothetical protein